VSAARTIACAAALALALPETFASAHAGVWAPPERPDADTSRSEPAPGWDDEPIAPPPEPGAPAPVAAAPAPTPAPAPPSEARRRVGTGLLIGAGGLAAVGTILNGARVYIVSGPCQREGQPGCEVSWGLVTPFAWIVNLASIGLAGAGAGVRGRYDATVDPEAHARRRAPLVAAGASLLVVGFATSLTLRALWLNDYSDPQGREIFDFAKTGHALGYYGGLQLSSIAMAAGVAMLVHSTARGRRTAKRRGSMVAVPSPFGLAMSGRF
jgi:hypothetical protein